MNLINPYRSRAVWLYSLLMFGIMVVSAHAETRTIVDTSQSPHAKLQGLNLDDVSWQDGFWGNWFDTIESTTLPLLHKLAADPVRGAVQNFEIAAGRSQSEYQGNNWMDAWVYKWMEAAASVYCITRDPALDRKMDQMIELIASAQEDDGYLATQNTARGRPRFQQPGHHEVYTMGHLLTAAVIHHRMTGKENFLKVARRTADFLADQFAGKPARMAHFPYNPSVIMGAVELYRETREKRYLQLANDVIDMRGAFPNGSDQTQDRVPLREETEVVGHAVFYTYLFAGAADAYLETGDERLLSTLTRLWEDLVERKLYITGGTCATYRGLSVRNGSIYTADIVHEAVGPRYWLPKSPAYNETCGQIGNFMWNWRMLAITGEARYADIIEREMYNGFLPAIGTDGAGFTYTNPLRWYGADHDLWAQDSLLRHEPAQPMKHRPRSVHGTCCPSNILRALAQIGNYFYSTSENALWIHQYGNHSLDNDQFALRQRTGFPWKGDVDITVQRAADQAKIKLRIPSWASTYQLSLNGERLTSSIGEDGYITVDHRWNSGDVLHLKLPMNVRMMRGHRKIDATHNQVAITRGPLVYCLESTDLPEGVDVAEVIIPRDIDFNAEFQPQVLGGIVTLRGKALRVPKDDSQLYSVLPDSPPQPIDIQLIPYYAWKNRGVSEMSVWLPVAW